MASRATRRSAGRNSPATTRIRAQAAISAAAPPAPLCCAPPDRRCRCAGPPAAAADHVCAHDFVAAPRARACVARLSFFFKQRPSLRTLTGTVPDRREAAYSAAAVRKNGGIATARLCPHERCRLRVEGSARRPTTCSDPATPWKSHRAAFCPQASQTILRQTCLSNVHSSQDGRFGS